MNAIQTVQAVRQADGAVLGWPVDLFHQVTRLCPPHVLEEGQSKRDWAITVQLLQRAWETPLEAAQRLALYLDVHRERYNDTPTLATIQENRKHA